MANKKIKQNRYKPMKVSGDKPVSPAPGSRKFSRMISIAFMMGLMGLSAIWLHDAVVQSPFFTIRHIEISGLSRVSRNEVLDLADLNRAGKDGAGNLFDIRPNLIEQKLGTHPWVARAKVKRQLRSTLIIRVEEETPLAIVTIENLADIIINTQGVPIKEYDPEKDGLTALPVISGMDLSLSDNRYLFEGELFNSVMDLLKVKGLSQIRTVHGDEHTGILIQAPDIYNKSPDTENKISENHGSGMETMETKTVGPRILIPIKLGFHQFEQKLARAREISRYMAARYPSKTILAMDLYDIEKIFIKTEDTLHNTLEKGV